MGLVSSKGCKLRLPPRSGLALGREDVQEVEDVLALWSPDLLEAVLIVNLVLEVPDENLNIDSVVGEEV